MYIYYDHTEVLGIPFDLQLPQKQLENKLQSTSNKHQTSACNSLPLIQICVW